MRLLFSAMLALIFLVGSVGAEPPAVTGVFPRGGAAGQTVSTTVEGKLSGATGVWCSSDSIKFELPESGNVLKATISEDAAPGLVWMRFHNAEGCSGAVPFVVGRLPEVLEKEPNNEFEKAEKLEASSVVNGKLGQSGDVDNYSISVPAGQFLVAMVDANWRLGSQVDAVLQFVGPNGAVLEQVDDDHGNDPFLAWKAEQDTNVVVRLFGFPAKPNSSIVFTGAAGYVYRLSVTTGPWVNHAMPSVMQKANLSTTRLAGWNLSGDLLEEIPVIDESGSPAIQGVPHAVSLPVVDRPTVVVKEPSDRTMPLDVETRVTACGVIDAPNDEDAVRFTAKKGSRLLLKAESRSLGYPLDPALRVLNAEGKVLVESDDATRGKFDSLLKYTVPADGQYVVTIRDLFADGGWRFAYRLHITPLEPSCSASVKTETFKLTPGTPLEIPVTVARNDGFAEEVTFTIEGLPEGVAAEPIKSQAKGDTSKAVKLIVKGDAAAPFNGQVQIVGRYGDGKTIRATAALATFNTSIDNLFLTVLKKKEAEEKPKDEKPAAD